VTLIPLSSDKYCLGGECRVPTHTDDDKIINTDTSAFPDSFIWYVFLSLAEAGIAMKQGDQSLAVAQPGWPAAGVHPAGWQIVHRDLKPRNVFFGNPDIQHFPDYVTPKASLLCPASHPQTTDFLTQLGDFGLAFKTRQGDALNPTIYLDSGTPGYFAPVRC